MIMIIVQSGRVTSDEEEADYDYTSKWEYLGKGIWENQVRGGEVAQSCHFVCQSN